MPTSEAPRRGAAATLILEGPEFGQIRDLAHRLAGFNLTEEKLPVVQFRLSARLRSLGFGSFQEYLDLVARDPAELWAMIEAVANHNTSFFRDSVQHPILRAGITEWLTQHRDVRIWSAGCSTGEEPFTLAMLVREWYGEASARIRILGTDLSSRALATARQGRYKREAADLVPEPMRTRCLVNARQSGMLEVSADVRRLVRLAGLNLMDPWPMRKRFHAIFCRNVMMYFDRDTQRRLTGRFVDALAPGGLLFLGQSEGLLVPPDQLTFVSHAVYRKTSDE